MFQTFVNVVQFPECDDVLCQDSVTLHHDVIRGDLNLNDASFKISNFYIDSATLK